MLEMFSLNKNEARNLFIDFMNERNNDICFEANEECKMNDVKAADLIKEIGNIATCKDLQYLDKNKRNEILRNLKEKGISIRQIARITGLNRGIVLRA